MPNSNTAEKQRDFEFVLRSPTRERGLDRLNAFVPQAGKRYAAMRNFDLGPAYRTNVSALSPWIRHRLISEEEVIRAVLEKHRITSAEKFIQEVLWRTYWKGWLEMRPSVWRDYLKAVDGWSRQILEGGQLKSQFDGAVEGRTGIECFDAWARELVEYGYLHNHARMWFASIWIFTLKLPWELGADFFLRNLLDGDPASNTLSWRWIAGLQTPGKTYLARPSNIEKYTGGRFTAVKELALTASPQQGAPLPLPTPVPPVAQADLRLPSGLLVTEEDCLPETLDLAGVNIKAAAGYVCNRYRSPLPVGDLAKAFAEGAVTDGLTRAGKVFNCPTAILLSGESAEGFENWICTHGIRQVLTAYPPVGPTQERLQMLKVKLAGIGVALVYVRRDWDLLFWPHATKGFFPFKQRIPQILDELSMLDS
jgi:deoxyribodipyrimidine photo-lyase